MITLALLAATLAAAAATSAGATVLANGSFEAQALSAGTYVYPGAVLADWNYAGAALVSGLGSNVWYGGTAPIGSDTQFAALQGSSNISQSFTATAKTMDLAWVNAGRPFGGNQSYNVTVDGTAVGASRSTVEGTAFTQQTKQLTGLTIGQTYNLGFQGIATTDQTAFLDNVSLTASSTLRPNMIDNGGFESANIGTGNYTYWGTSKDGWNYGGSIQVNAQGANPWYGAVAPTGFGGAQFAAIQGGGSLSTTFISNKGKLNISWLAGGRPSFGNGSGGDQSYLVKLDGSVLGSFVVTSGQAFGLNSLMGSGLPYGAHTLSFVGLSATDNTAFIDNVSVTAVPEASTWAMLGTGFMMVGFAARRRSVVVSA